MESHLKVWPGRNCFQTHVDQRPQALAGYWPEAAINSLLHGFLIYGNTLVSYCCIPNYYKFRNLTHCPFILSQFYRSESRRAWLDSLGLIRLKSRYQLCWALIWKIWGKKSTFILFYVVGGIQFLVAVGLRSVLYCQPSLGGWSLLLEAACVPHQVASPSTKPAMMWWTLLNLQVSPICLFCRQPEKAHCF